MLDERKATSARFLGCQAPAGVARIEVSNHHQIRFCYGDSSALKPAVSCLRMERGRRSYTFRLIYLCVEFTAHLAQLGRKTERRDKLIV